MEGGGGKGEVRAVSGEDAPRAMGAPTGAAPAGAAAAILEAVAVDNGQLRLTDRFLGDDGAGALLAALEEQGRTAEVTALDLTGCNLHECTSVVALVRGLPSLKRLSLEWNAVGLDEAGFGTLARAIAEAPMLAQVDMRNNRVGVAGAQALGAALGDATPGALRTLDLRWNDLGGDAGVQALLGGIRDNTSVQDLRLNPVLLSVADEQALELVLARNRGAADNSAVASARNAAHAAALGARQEAAGAARDAAAIAQERGGSASVSLVEADLGSGEPLPVIGKPTLREVELAERIAGLQAEVLEAKQRCISLADENDGWAKRFEGAQEALKAAESRAEEHRAALATTQLDLEKARQEVEAANVKMRDASSAAAAASAEIESLRRTVTAAAESRYRAEAARADSSEEAAKELRSKLAHAEAEIGRVRAELDRHKEGEMSKVQALESRLALEAEYHASEVARVEEGARRSVAASTAALNAARERSTLEVTRAGDELVRVAEARDEALQQLEQERAKALESATEHQEALRQREERHAEEVAALETAWGGRVQAAEKARESAAKAAASAGARAEKARKAHAAAQALHEDQLRRAREQVSKVEGEKVEMETQIQSSKASVSVAEHRAATNAARAEAAEATLKACRERFEGQLADLSSRADAQQEVLASELDASRARLAEAEDAARTAREAEQSRRREAERCLASFESGLAAWAKANVSQLRADLAALGSK